MGVGTRVLDFNCGTGKFEFRSTSNTSAVDHGTSTKFQVAKEDHHCYKANFRRYGSWEEAEGRSFEARSAEP